MATRAALRPAPLGGVSQGQEDKDKLPSPPPSASSSFDSSRSSVDLSKPYPKSKPKWLRRASITPALRTMSSRSPAGLSVDLPAAEATVSQPAGPPPLPPRNKFPSGPLDTPMTAGPSRTPPPPPQHPGRAESISSISHHHNSLSSSGRSRWAWGQSTAGVQRSASSNSISSTVSHQRIPSSASRVLGQAGSAVSKTWMRARGVGGSMSISGLGSLAQVRGMEPDFTGPGSYSTPPSSLSRKLSRDVDIAPIEVATWEEGIVKRRARVGYPKGHVFGRPIDTVGRTWGVYDAAEERLGESEYEQRRRRCLPAVVVRCVEYLTTWGPKEEGIFRISGRASHLQKLRKEFDAGADLDLMLSDPGDLDPHAIAGTFKSYIRELPDQMLPPYVESQLDEYLHKRKDDVDLLVGVIAELPSANWFLLADVISLIDLIPRHADVNRMSHNALMISLGPTLRLSGDHVTLLLRHREVLFANPPMVSVSDLIDFGSDELLTLSPTYEDLALPSPVPSSASSIKKPAPRLAKKNSFSNLLGGGRASVRRSQSEQALSVSPVPPRLALPEPVQVDLPSFRMTEDIDEGDEMESLDTDVAKASDVIEDAQYAPGTVASRARVFSTPTPIADRFRRTSTISDLRPPKTESIASSFSSVSDSLSGINGEHVDELPVPPNPLVGLRRSPPIFFQSKAGSRSASPSSTSSVVSNVAVPVAPPAEVVPVQSAGKKRKDDASRVRDPDGAPGGAKRLSSGPSLDDEVLVRV